MHGIVPIPSTYGVENTRREAQQGPMPRPRGRETQDDMCRDESYHCVVENAYVVCGHATTESCGEGVVHTVSETSIITVLLKPSHVRPLVIASFDGQGCQE